MALGVSGGGGAWILFLGTWCHFISHGSRFIPWKRRSNPSEVGRGSQCVTLQGPPCTLPPHSSPNAIDFFQFGLVYSQSSFSRLTEGVLRVPTAASYRSGERARTGASRERQKEVSVGCRQLRNDNHTQLSSTPRPPARTPSSALPSPSAKGINPRK